MFLADSRSLVAGPKIVRTAADTNAQSEKSETLSEGITDRVFRDSCELTRVEKRRFSRHCARSGPSISVISLVKRTVRSPETHTTGRQLRVSRARRRVRKQQQFSATRQRLRADGRRKETITAAARARSRVRSKRDGPNVKQCDTVASYTENHLCERGDGNGISVYSTRAA